MKSPNLWSVSFTFDGGVDSNVKLWICASTPGVAERKARRVLRDRGFRAVMITGVDYSGTIDAI